MHFSMNRWINPNVNCDIFICLRYFHRYWKALNNDFVPNTVPNTTCFDGFNFRVEKLHYCPLPCKRVCIVNHNHWFSNSGHPEHTNVFAWYFIWGIAFYMDDTSHPFCYTKLDINDLWENKRPMNGANKLKLAQKYLPDGSMKYISLQENHILIEVSLMIDHLCTLDNKSAVVQKLAWSAAGNNPLPGPMKACSLVQKQKSPSYASNSYATQHIDENSFVHVATLGEQARLKAWQCINSEWNTYLVNAGAKLCIRGRCDPVHLESTWSTSYVGTLTPLHWTRCTAKPSTSAQGNICCTIGWCQHRFC